MNPEKRLAHIAAYFLSRFDKRALTSLGYRNDRQAFEDIAKKLSVLPNYIKFSRDEFDVEHPHRKGWHKRPMSPSISSVIETFRGLDMTAMESIMQDILYSESSSQAKQDLQTITRAMDENLVERTANAYTPRGITGRKAEEVFIKWFATNGSYFGHPGSLLDRRDHGCGYDFSLEIRDQEPIAIEVKGLSGANSGILLTAKEWDTAKNMASDYYLALISSMDSEPFVELICDPYRLFAPKRNMQTVIQISWTLSATQLRKDKTRQ